MCKTERGYGRAGGASIVQPAAGLYDYDRTGGVIAI